MLPLAAEFNCPITGGDTNSWNGSLVISVTALGEVPRERRWRRAAHALATPSWSRGQFGGSISGKQFDFSAAPARSVLAG